MSEALDLAKEVISIAEEQSKMINDLNEYIKKYQKIIAIQEQMMKNLERIIAIQDNVIENKRTVGQVDKGVSLQP